MVDLHCHILPGVDDGAVNLEQALAMARICVEDGVTHVFATPHCHSFLRLLKTDIVPRVEHLNRELATAGIGLTVLPGSEIQVVDVSEYRRDYEAGVFCHLGGTKSFTLFELSWTRSAFAPDAADLVRWLRERGTQPILAHPERYDYFWHEPDLLEPFADAGVWLQITSDSLLGNFGPAAREAGHSIIGRYENIVISSDAHNLRSRRPGLSAAFRWVEENFGPARKDDLLNRANRVLEGQGLN